MNEEHYPETVDFLEEIEDQHLIASGAGDGVRPAGLSTWLGNKGRFCTVTVECMPSCN